MTVLAEPLPDDSEALKALLIAERAAHAAEAERLRLIIRELQRYRFGRRAESLPVDQLELGLEDVQQVEADNSIDVLEDRRTDPTHHELVSAINDLNDDEQLDLIALIWIGRGDFSLAEWSQARQAARDIGRQRAPRYVVEIPLVSDYLEDALSQLGLSLVEYLDAH